jgi:hypothetical protein
MISDTVEETPKNKRRFAPPNAYALRTNTSKMGWKVPFVTYMYRM